MHPIETSKVGVRRTLISRLLRCSVCLQFPELKVPKGRSMKSACTALRQRMTIFEECA